jgi:fatty acid synthase subunit beta
MVAWIAFLTSLISRIRSKLNKKADLRLAIARDNSADFKIINGVETERPFQTINVLPRANFHFDFPSLEATSSLQDLAHLHDLIGLDQYIVITGFAEVGPWGSSRTR